MSNKSKNTGLGKGVDALFPRDEAAANAEDAASVESVALAEDVASAENTERAASAPRKRAKAKAVPPVTPDKYRTTVMLYADTLSDIELLKAAARKQGVKMTMSDVLNDAVRLLVQKRKIRPQ